MEKISVVVSCYNEEKALPLFYQEMERVRKQDFENVADFDYIFVNDGSKDKTLEIIKQLRSKDNKVRYNRPEISEIITKNVPFLGIAHLDMSKPITELVSKQDSRDELINKFNILIRDINKSLDTNDDW